jgi:hypothetical protein
MRRDVLGSSRVSRLGRVTMISLLIAAGKALLALIVFVALMAIMDFAPAWASTILYLCLSLVIPGATIAIVVYGLSTHPFSSADVVPLVMAGVSVLLILGLVAPIIIWPGAWFGKSARKAASASTPNHRREILIDLAVAWCIFTALVANVEEITRWVAVSVGLVAIVANAVIHNRLRKRAEGQSWSA